MNIWPKWARVARSRLSRSARGPISARYSCSIATPRRSEEHTSELQSHSDLVCRLLLEKKKNSNIKFNLTILLQQLNVLETLVIIMVANKYAFLQITRRRFLNEWKAFKKEISRRNIRRPITIPLLLTNLNLLFLLKKPATNLHSHFPRRHLLLL